MRKSILAAVAAIGSVVALVLTGGVADASTTVCATSTHFQMCLNYGGVDSENFDSNSLYLLNKGNSTFWASVDLNNGLNFVRRAYFGAVGAGAMATLTAKNAPWIDQLMPNDNWFYGQVNFGNGSCEYATIQVQPRYLYMSPVMSCTD